MSATMLAPDLKKQALKELNDLGDDLLDLDKCSEFKESLLMQREVLIKECSISNPDGLIGATIKEANSVVNQCKSATQQTTDVVKSVENHLREVQEVRSDLKGKLDKLNVYRTTLQYMKVLQQVESLCGELKDEISKKDDEKCVTLFANLTEISRLISDCSVNNLKDYLKESILFWYNILKDKLGKDYEEVLKLLKWPLKESALTILPFEVNINKLQILAEYLLQIELPSELNIPVEGGPNGILSSFHPPPLPIQFLIQPLRKRFLYHFYGNRKTNRQDRPEWYFTQVLTWIRDHQDCVGNWIQSVIDKFGLHHIDAKIEFMRGLVQLAAEKLNSDLPQIQYDDFTFSHTIDEALGFDKELREVYYYPQTEPSIVLVLTQASVLVKWLIMEKKYAAEKMDAMLSPSSLDAFDLLTSDVEDLKITTCADAFITLLQTIAERYEGLPQPGHRIQFFELQLELLDDFRVRLLQIVNAEQGDYMDTKIPMIANTLYYVEGVLVDWGTMLHYLNLYYYKTQTNGQEQQEQNSYDLDDDSEPDSLFTETLSLYRHFRHDIIMGLVEAVILEVKKKSWDYRRENWASMKVGKDLRSLSLTPSACPLFGVLAKRLHQLQNKLQSKLFTIAWRNIAFQLDGYLFEDLVLDSRFNDGGALQLKFDVTRNLLPLFAQYTDMAGNHFTNLSESCNLLNLAKGSALLLRETLLALEETSGVEDTRSKMLQEIGVKHFSPREAIKILNQRVDITIQRS